MAPVGTRWPIADLRHLRAEAGGRRQHQLQDGTVGPMRTVGGFVGEHLSNQALRPRRPCYG